MIDLSILAEILLVDDWLQFRIFPSWVNLKEFKTINPLDIFLQNCVTQLVVVIQFIQM